MTISDKDHLRLAGLYAKLKPIRTAVRALAKQIDSEGRAETQEEERRFESWQSELEAISDEIEQIVGRPQKAMDVHAFRARLAKENAAAPKQLKADPWARAIAAHNEKFPA